MNTAWLFKWRLAALVAVNVIAIALVAIGLNQLYVKATREAEIRSQNIALGVDLHLSNEISKLDLSLQTVAAEIDRLLDRGEAERNRLIGALIQRQKAALPETESWSVTDADGKVIFHAGGATPPAFSVADREYFIDLKSGRSDGLLVTKPLTSRVSGNRIIVLARAIVDANGRFHGTVVVPLPVSSLHHMLSGYDMGTHGAIFLRDADMEPIVSFAARQGDDVERIYSYRTLGNAPIQVAAGISKQDFLEKWRLTAWSLSAVCALLLLACNTTIVLLYRQWRLQQHTACALKEGNARLEASLQQLRERDDALLAAQQAGRLGTYTLDITAKTWTCSAQLDSIFGIDKDYDHTIEGWEQLIHPRDRGRMAQYFSAEVIGKRGVFNQEYRIVRPSDGRVVWVHGLGRLDPDAAGHPVRMSGTIQDVSARRASDDRLHLVDEVFLNATEGIVVTDREGAILETNLAFTRITGYSAEEAKGQNPRMLNSGVQDADFYAALWHDLFAAGRWDGELINRRKDGATYVQHSRIFAIRDAHGEIENFAAVISDVSALKESQRRLEHLAYYDELTGLPNRVLLSERMRRAMSDCRREGVAQLAVCCLDLDGFKDINDRLGHDTGDRLLVEVAQRLKRHTRPDETVARLGGDEFVVLFCDFDAQRDAHAAVERLLQMAAEPYAPGGTRMQITLSIGVALYAVGGNREPDALLRQAHEAMYEAKRSGKNRVCFFDTESERRRREGQARQDRLAAALAQDEFRMHYQPKVCLRTGKLAGVEALIRWQHPERGLLPPQEFLPCVEATELTLPLGEWILGDALEQLRRWKALGLETGVSVNIFGLHLQREDFVERLAALLRRYPDIDPGRLELEVVETTALENLDEVTARIRGCMQLGVTFSLDDFGTGYSSLTYLRQLPVSKVKIDRSFVRDVLENTEDRVLVESIVGMAHTLGRQVVAEGVETFAHGALLIHCGCDFAQGYGIARPMAPEQLPEWARHWTMPDVWEEAAHRLPAHDGNAPPSARPRSG